MKKSLRLISIFALILLTVCLFGSAALADEAAAEDGSASTSVTEVENKGMAASIAIAAASACGAIAMGLVISSAIKGTARQPEAHGKIQGMMMLGLVFVETAIIYALVTALLIIFVL